MFKKTGNLGCSYRNKLICFLMISLSYTATCSAQEIDSSSTQDDALAKLIDFFDGKLFGSQDNFSYAVSPTASVDDVKGLEFGAMTMLSFSKKKDNYTRMTPSARMSLKGYWSVKYEVESYIGKWHILSDLSYEDFIARFYPMVDGEHGQDYFQYNVSRAILTGIISYDILHYLRLGLNIDFCHMNSSKRDSIYFEENTLGEGKTNAFGLGPTLVFDTRNTSNSTQKGDYLELASTLFAPPIASDFKFQNYLVEYRHFSPIRKHGVIACQLHGEGNVGKAPFYKMPSIAGPDRLRGLGHPNQYSNKIIYYGQVEYRHSFTSSLATVGYAGFGNSHHKIDEQLFEDLKYAVGAGIRIMILPEEHINIRFDYGIGSNNTHSFFMGLSEAF